MKNYSIYIPVILFLLIVSNTAFPDQNMLDILNGLKLYISSFDNAGAILLSYDVVVEKPALSENDAKKYANISMQEQLKRIFNDPDINSLKEETRSRAIRAFREGSLHSEKRNIQISKDSSMLDARTSNGDLLYEEKESGAIVEITDRSSNVLNHTGEEKRRTETRDKFGSLKYHFFFMNWCEFVKRSEVNKIERSLSNDNVNVLSYSHPDYKSYLHVKEIGTKYIPIKYIISTPTYETITTYENYDEVGGVLIPQTIIEENLQTDKPSGLIAITGPYRIFYVLTKQAIIGSKF